MSVPMLCAVVCHDAMPNTPKLSTTLSDKIALRFNATNDPADFLMIVFNTPLQIFNPGYALEIVIWICSFSSLRFLGEICVFAWEKKQFHAKPQRTQRKKNKNKRS